MTDSPTTAPRPGDTKKGYVFTEQGTWAPTEPPKKTHKIRNVTLGVLGLIVIGSMVGAADDDDESSDTTSQAAVSAPAEKPAKPAKAEKPEGVQVDAAAMLAEFEGNEAAADAKYKGQTVAITGSVEKVDAEFWNDEQYTIQLSGGGFWTVNCNDVTADVAATVQAGSIVKVSGTFDDGGDLGVEVKDCTLA